MKGASNLAEGIDKAFYFILGIDLLLLVGLTVLIIYIVIRYNRKRHPKAVQVKEKVWLEILWTVIPLIIVLAMFYVGYMQYRPAERPPKEAIKITVVGRMWDWIFRYEDGRETDKLIIPHNKPVLLKLESADVLHSLYIPAFRIKKDLVPGRKDNYMWFIPTIKDTFDIECTAFCGLRHSYMLSKAIVIDTGEFNKWYSEKPVKTPLEEIPGYVLVKDNGCLGCHSIDGSKLVGPTFKGMYGMTSIAVSKGKEKAIKMDEDYMREKILGSSEFTAKGYPAGVMRAYNGVLNEEQIKEIIDYLKTVK